MSDYNDSSLAKVKDLKRCANKLLDRLHHIKMDDISDEDLTTILEILKNIKYETAVVKMPDGTTQERKILCIDGDKDWNLPYIDRYTVALLHFDNYADPFKDECGNTWTPVGSPIIGTDNAAYGKALQLDGNSYLQLDRTLPLGGQDFTIECVGIIDSENCMQYSAFFASQLLEEGGRPGEWFLGKYPSNNILCMGLWDDNAVGVKMDTAIPENVLITVKHHYAWVYVHSLSKLFIFVDGKRVETADITFARRERYFWIGKCGYSKSLFKMAGAVDEFRISDGIARWTEDFTPPTEPY